MVMTVLMLTIVTFHIQMVVTMLFFLSELDENIQNYPDKYVPEEEKQYENEQNEP